MQRLRHFDFFNSDWYHYSLPVMTSAHLVDLEYEYLAIHVMYYTHAVFCKSIHAVTESIRSQKHQK